MDQPGGSKRTEEKLELDDRNSTKRVLWENPTKTEICDSSVPGGCVSIFYINNLPSTLLEDIFFQADAVEQGRLRWTCKYWNAIILSATIRKTLAIRLEDAPITYCHGRKLTLLDMEVGDWSDDEHEGDLNWRATLRLLAPLITSSTDTIMLRYGPEPGRKNKVTRYLEDPQHFSYWDINDFLEKLLPIFVKHSAVVRIIVLVEFTLDFDTFDVILTRPDYPVPLEKCTMVRGTVNFNYSLDSHSLVEVRLRQHATITVNIEDDYEKKFAAFIGRPVNISPDWDDMVDFFGSKLEGRIDRKATEDAAVVVINRDESLHLSKIQPGDLSTLDWTQLHIHTLFILRGIMFHSRKEDDPAQPWNRNEQTWRTDIDHMPGVCYTTTMTHCEVDLRDSVTILNRSSYALRMN